MIKNRGDKWLPTPTSFSVQSPQKILSDDAKVAELIDPDLKNWNVGLIKAIFSKDEAKVILGILLRPLLPHDCLIWRGTSNGLFSVRSAYHLAKELQDDLGGQCSSTEKGSEVWKRMWSMEVPQVVKIFLWRVFNNALPTRANLFKRKVVEVCKCSICGSDDETTSHAIWSCPSTRDVWGGGSSPFEKCVSEGYNFMQVFEYCMGRYKQEELSLLAVVSRCIWLRRNKFIFEGEFTHPNVVFSKASKSLDKFTKCNRIVHDLEQPAECSPGPVHQQWHPPPSGFVKINWDVAINEKDGWIGLGIVARDCKGCLFSARSIPINLQVAPKMAEVMAAFHAIQFSREAGFFEVIFEGDAVQVVNEVNMQDSPNFTIAGHFIEGIQQELTYLRAAHFIHVPRVCNSAMMCKFI